MGIWERVFVNMQKGAWKVTVFAAFFSERVKAEVRIVRLRLKMESVQKRIDGLYRAIGKRALELKAGAVVRSTDDLFKDDVISAAVTEIAKLEKKMEDLNAELKRERSSADIPKSPEDTAA